MPCRQSRSSFSSRHRATLVPATRLKYRVASWHITRVRACLMAVELAVILGQKARDIKADQANDYIGGYGMCEALIQLLRSI